MHISLHAPTPIPFRPYDWIFAFETEANSRVSLSSYSAGLTYHMDSLKSALPVAELTAVELKARLRLAYKIGSLTVLNSLAIPTRFLGPCL